MRQHSISRLASMLILLLSFLPPAITVNSQNTEIEIEGWDMSALDAKIADAVSKANAPNASAEDRLAAANIYLTRANLFYNAGRPPLYKLALGDFRRVLRFQPDNSEAKEKADQIISIYKQMGRPVPHNGEETDIYNDPTVHYKLKPEPINFPAGESSTTISEELPPDLGHVYEIDVKPNQRINVNMTSDNSSTVLSIYQGDLEFTSLMMIGAKTWDGVAADNGKYLIEVWSKRGGATYKLEVTVR